MAELTSRAIYDGVKRVIARKKNMDPADVYAAYVLRDPPLRFTTAGVRALAKPLSEEFTNAGIVLTTGAVGAAKSVMDIHKLIWEQV
jgi:hypothetical protein